ncbi:universal stress protein [Methylocystis bryophila]|uniref:Universal stress protein UspA n=1 Tax=Methylocystis bryophila TaxID=655015 RepID=A0A1W6N0I4_9HYPH|nr:universal stress protein [Methylocystis bryophila]ARN83335.1 universal stress protein UspA [Methylocystis bryophila]
MLRKLLLPIDLAEPEFATRAIEAAQTLAKPFDSELRLVNVQSLVPLRFVDYVPEDFEKDIRDALEAELAAIAAKIDRPKDRVSSVVLFGPIHDRILEEAERWGADLIVISSHRPGMERFLIGSNASAIVKRAKCSVLVLRG